MNQKSLAKQELVLKCLRDQCIEHFSKSIRNHYLTVYKLLLEIIEHIDDFGYDDYDNVFWLKHDKSKYIIYCDNMYLVRLIFEEGTIVDSYRVNSTNYNLSRGNDILKTYLTSLKESL